MLEIPRAVLGDTMTYQWNSEEYAKNSAAQFEWALELIAKLRLRGDEAVLDVGSGDGKVTALIAAAVPRGEAVGIDNSSDMVTFARQTFPRDRFPNLSFEQMDAREILFTGRFDAAFSNATLHWVRNQPAVLRGVRRSLKPGGRLLFQMAGRGNAAEILAVLDVLLSEPRWIPHFKDFTFPYAFCGPDEYRSWLAEAGLAPVRVELIPKDMKQAGRDGLAGWVRTTWLPWTERVPQDRREAFIAAVVETYLRDHPADADGTIHVQMSRLEVEATNPF